MEELFSTAFSGAHPARPRYRHPGSIVLCFLIVLGFLILPVTAAVPVSSFTASTYSGSIPLTVTFTDASTNSPTSWAWDFGDSSSSTAQNPTHTFNDAGTYTVTLVATNADGSSTNTATKSIVVSALAPDADFEADVTSGSAPLTVQFTDLSDNSPTSWSWTFGDGYVSTEKDPEHTYSDEGTYTVILVVENTAGSDTKTRTKYITVAEADDPVASFTADVTSGDAPLTVEFEDTSTYYPTSWKWTFGDGDTSTEQDPEHTYSDEGTYTVTLKVTNGEGSDSVTKKDYIVVGDLTAAAFSASPVSGTAPLTVKFTDASTYDPTEWYWSFGDGYSSVAQSPSHTYNNAGTYTVALTATNDVGSNTVTKTSLVTVTAPTTITTVPTTIRTTARTTATTAAVVATETTAAAAASSDDNSIWLIGGIVVIVVAVVGFFVWRAGRGNRWDL